MRQVGGIDRSAPSNLLRFNRMVMSQPSKEAGGSDMDTEIPTPRHHASLFGRKKGIGHQKERQ
jgi:hypothetical protein